MTSEFYVSVSYSVDALSDAVADALTDVLAVSVIGVLPDIGAEELFDVKVSVFEVVITPLEFVMPAPLCEFSC